MRTTHDRPSPAPRRFARNEWRVAELTGRFPSAVRLSLCLALALLVAAPALAQEPRAEYRAFWVDTFNTALNNHADVLAVVNNAKAARANAIFAQVRRRGDSFYLDSLEPTPDFTVFTPAGFDPLRDLIATAHAEGIEVHAFVIMSAVWSKNPTFAPSATLGPPISDEHVFNKHGWNKATNSMRTGADNWLTRSLAPFPAGVTFDGQRYGSDFWIDFGHPDAAAYTVEVLMHLVRNYDIDGLHLDRIRYPEINITGQTPATGANVGYNQTSVERFQRRFGIAAGSPPPPPNNAQWAQWRRDQVSNVVRRVYLNAVAIKPQIKVSAALIAFGGAPVCNAGADCKSIWQSSAAAEAYWRVYQDWRSWTEEGILDIAAPMNYKREHISAQATQFNTWIEWTKNNQYNRTSIVGVGNFVNSVEGSIRQVRRSLAPSAQGKSAGGVIFFSMGTSNVFTNNGGAAGVPNPFSVPPGQLTPTRSYAEFASGLTTGKSVNGATLYEPDANSPGFAGVFSQAAAVPVLPWKAAPTVGHLMGFARRADSSALDTATVTITNLDTNATRATATDGGGFYGGVDLAPGSYLVKAELGSDTLYSCVAAVTAGQVTTANLTAETTAPTTTAETVPEAPNGSNGWFTSNVSVLLNATDGCSGVASTEYSTDGGATWTPYAPASAIAISTEGTTTVLYRSTDRAGNVEPAQSLVVKLDKSAPTLTLSADPSVIWPPNGQTVNVTLSGAGADAVSGLGSVSYAVTDEYGAPLSIPARSLAGASVSWADSLAVEARREGGDADGRLYRVIATLRDAAGNTTFETVSVVVPHDQRKD